ncbi:hypothetical protein [Streptomyces sp. H27-C3]|uniref:hypothetical protein n=1 Tax=Streptomyces sp. H27-C3 TaxID=3046305 RepID=UPI0024BB9418|nr:hypothetical protein [Streptomyces sp. H27-C3]MDJ0465004.1 hypothetical protein [Streptomyces sp. H27-C3]
MPWGKHGKPPPPPDPTAEEDPVSITFTAAHRPPVGYAVTCGCDGATVRAPRFGDYRDALAAADRASAAGTRDALPGCDLPETCPEYPLHAEDVDPDGPVPWVNFSNVNAIGVLEALGFPVQPGPQDEACDALEDGLPLEADGPGVVIPIAVVDACGELPAEDFRGRVLTALGLAPEDPGRPDIRLGRTLLLGRPAGYLQRRLTELHALADWCAAHGRDVAWH